MVVYIIRITEIVVALAALIGAWFCYKSQARGRFGDVIRAAYTWGYLLMGLAFAGLSVRDYFLFSGRRAISHSVLAGARTIGAIGALAFMLALTLSLLGNRARER